MLLREQNASTGEDLSLRQEKQGGDGQKAHGLAADYLGQLADRKRQKKGKTKTKLAGHNWASLLYICLRGRWGLYDCCRLHVEEAEKR